MDVARRRLFVAVDLDDASRTACATVAEQLRAKAWPGRWVAPENYHLTAAFLGGADEQRVADVRVAIRDAASRLAPFELPLNAVGAFPNAGRPRVAWVGPAEPVDAFGHLCETVRHPLTALGFTFERHTDAHVTLARSDGRVALPAATPPGGRPLHVAALTLYRSLTERAGVRYDAIERFTLAA
jgi:RNA 2',3'-cyclic 3'-phosphodiesterase